MRPAFTQQLPVRFQTAFQPLPDQHTVAPGLPALDELRAPGTRALNLSRFKWFPLREHLKLPVWTESTGATNTPISDPLGTNMSQAATFGVISSAGAAGQCRDRCGDCSEAWPASAALIE